MRGLRPSKMSEGSVGFGHAVRILFLLEGGAGFVVGIDYLGLEAFAVGHAGFAARGFYEPREGEVELAVTANWEGDLVVGATDAAGFDLEVGGDVFEGLLEDFGWILGLEFLGCTFDGGIASAFGDLLLAV